MRRVLAIGALLEDPVLVEKETDGEDEDAMLVYRVFIVRWKDIQVVVRDMSRRIARHYHNEDYFEHHGR